MALRSNVDPYSVVKQLKGMRCPSPSLMPKKGGKVLSCSDALAKVLERYLNETYGEKKGEEVKGNGEEPEVFSHEQLRFDFQHNTGTYTKNIAGMCPECGSILEHEGGCVTCNSCGYSKC